MQQKIVSYTLPTFIYDQNNIHNHNTPHLWLIIIQIIIQHPNRPRQKQKRQHHKGRIQTT